MYQLILTYKNSCLLKNVLLQYVYLIVCKYLYTPFLCVSCILYAIYYYHKIIYNVRTFPRILIALNKFYTYKVTVKFKHNHVVCTLTLYLFIRMYFI